MRHIPFYLPSLLIQYFHFSSPELSQSQLHAQVYPTDVSIRCLYFLCYPFLLWSQAFQRCLHDHSELPLQQTRQECSKTNPELKHTPSLQSVMWFQLHNAIEKYWIYFKCLSRESIFDGLLAAHEFSSLIKFFCFHLLISMKASSLIFGALRFHRVTLLCVLYCSHFIKGARQGNWRNVNL